jgi:hypothetical protein
MKVQTPCPCAALLFLLLVVLGDIQGIIADMEASIVRELENKVMGCWRAISQFFVQVLECAESVHLLGAKAFEIDW